MNEAITILAHELESQRDQFRGLFDLVPSSLDDDKRLEPLWARLADMGADCGLALSEAMEVATDEEWNQIDDAMEPTKEESSKTV